jgi:two-component system sensor kinase FixL
MGGQDDHLDRQVECRQPSLQLDAVEDSGPGFPEDVQDRLFTAFYSTKASGMGVGLSICRTIVEAHGGRIWAETGAAGGAAFSFTLRRAKQGEADVEDGKSLCRR